MTDTQSIETPLKKAERLGIDTSVARAAIGDIEDAFAEAMEPDVVLGRAYRIIHAEELRKSNGAVDAKLLGRIIRGAVASAGARIVTGDEGELIGYICVFPDGSRWRTNGPVTTEADARDRYRNREGERVARLCLLPEVVDGE